MTHIENVSYICKHGITHVSSPNANRNYIPIGDGSLINSRDKKPLKNGKMLGDYIPFYFGVRMPMLYVIQKGFNSVTPVDAENIVYCVTSVQDVQDSGVEFLFTDGHAVDGLSRIFDESQLSVIESIVDFKAINSLFWKSETDLDLKRRKEAEFLIGYDFPPEFIRGWVVYNETAKNKLLSIGISDSKILIKPNFYF